MIKRLHTDNRGDTIVEVLICIAILGFLLAAAYTLTTRNQVATQKAQERSVAVRIAESQLERLREYIDYNKTLPTGKFCFEPASGGSGVNLIGFVSPAPDPDINIDTAANYVSQCTEGLYSIAVWGKDVSSAAGIGAKTLNIAGKDYTSFAVTVRWDTPGGSGKDEVKMFYTAYVGATP